MDETALDPNFTEREVYCALRLQLPDAEARGQAADFAHSYVPGMDWATSEGMLLYLAVGSESGSARVDCIRRSMQLQLRAAWVAKERKHDPAASDAEVTRAWTQHVEGAERDWRARIAALRQELMAEGRLPGDGKGE
jgi:hypothetical protein